MLINICRALAVIVSVRNFHVEIFHVVYYGNLPSFQCKKSLDWSVPMGEVDGLSLILIDLYIPVLISRLH
jgi:hypothetical protein